MRNVSARKNRELNFLLYFLWSQLLRKQLVTKICKKIQKMKEKSGTAVLSANLSLNSSRQCINSF